MLRCQFLTPRNIIMAPMRRKSHGSIRSPHVKRDSQSQVVIEGWLFKLEGGALKQWKQRWCVLADFCLFFYKGPHEEKITSSILLPSYKVNPCSTEDKISRKFAFKAEHQNMKTYYFAAEDKESMKRWMNAMSLASIMQKFVKSEHYDATFSSTSNDDEDSGFTSYRSKRFPNQNRANSSHDSSFRAEPLKHRSNSYGDRMEEVFLSNDDKYPSLYKSSPSHLYKLSNPREPPMRQPLYANAPPKPKRLTSSDSFGIYPNDSYDLRDKESAMDPSQYHLYHGDPEMIMRYAPDGGHERTMKYLPEHDLKGNDRTMKYLSESEQHDSHDRTVNYFPPDNVIYPDYSSTCYNDNSQPNTSGEALDLYRNQPPRPRSADFLERDLDCSVTPSSTPYEENPQPQRPKSSLECYNRYIDSEEYDFDDYREAVRMQADQLYANNKNLDKSRPYGFRHADTNTAKSEQRLNIHYVSNSHFDENSSYNVKECDRVEYGQKVDSSLLHRETYDAMVDESPTNKARKESMQRLLEWKQRMLQSPLSRKNQIRSNSSSDTSSPMNSPMKFSHQSSHSYKGKREYNTQNAIFQKSSIASRDEYLYSSEEQIISSYDTEQCNSYKKSHQVQTPGRTQSKDQKTNEAHNLNLVPVNRNNLNSSMPESSIEDNLYQENVMYCVDSENNEILFSYDDNSPTDCNVQSNHYPPMMHSFSTMPNVSDIGNDVQNRTVYERSSSLSRTSKGREDFPNGSKVLLHQEATTYSSDDEASVDSDGRYRIVTTKMKSLGISGSISDSDSNVPESSHLRKLVQQSEGLMCKGKRLSVSAGDLLGKTHEELVLLLIQLRRNQSKILRAKEKLELQFDNEHRKSQTIPHGLSQNYRELQRQIQQLETQYEITKPLVTLVDNMVKLGSLYGNSNRRSFSLPLLDSSQDQQPSNSEISQSLEQSSNGTSILSKLLTEENNLQKRIAEIYSLDKGLRYETDSISSLHQDKEMLEFTLSGMRNKILDHQDRPAELQKLRKQQRMIEKELVRVKKLLSASAKKIEDAASKNDQMEQEILLLRQILQQALKTGAPEMKTSQNNRADLEAELSRLQNVLDELANHRHEISNTVEKLKSDARSGMTKGAEVRASPTGVAGSAPLPLRKKHHSTYLETDLDTMTSRDLAIAHERDMEDIPVYVNAEEINIPNENVLKEDLSYSMVPSSSIACKDSLQYSMQDINEADDRMKRFYGILPKEKPCEIKTVRIVKRQSERRNRERDKKKVTYDDQSSVWVVEEPDVSSDDLLDADEGIVRKATIVPSTRPTSINLLNSNSNRSSNPQSAHERLFGSGSKKDKPIQQERPYSAKKSKRRHYTVSGYQYMLDPQFAQYFRERPRSRDDVDMERCLRTANTPDIVRSTIKKNEVYDDKIIERELGLPQKIDIPERYVEVEPETLSASEKLRRSQKAENICKMLSETTTSTYEDVVEERSKSPEAFHKKLSEEKRKRAHLLSLNRALAREVVERSKAVAANIYSPDNQAEP